ncbi:MAG: glycoside hydrolase family 3 C-terminal domain-containing protein [Oscillospiraceae bacterium]|nr:glycoside hydrolase family 3 C-terminal domain-containing protein [Oscillospiraceae bacterium]
MDKFEIKAQEIISKLTKEEKLGLLTTHHFAVERLGMDEFYIGTEVARGYVGREPDKISTVFPQPIGLAATFDRELLFELGKIAGVEARAYYNDGKKGGLMLWGPTVDMERDPRWGRTEEGYGEDVFLTGELTAKYTEGMVREGEDGTYLSIPTLKHFCADNNEEGRGHCNAYLPQRLKYEYYYAAFENAVINGGARSLMAAYNEINGLPAIMNDELETIVKDKWGLWFVVSDAGDLLQNVTAHRYCDDLSEAYALSLKGGCDVMTDDDDMVREAARIALEKGLITEDDIDRSLRRTIAGRLRLGQELDGTKFTNRFDSIDKSIIDCEEHRKVNRRAAEEQLVLLKNDMLPVADAKKIAVVGALADESMRDWYTGVSSYEVTVREGFEAAYPESEILFDSLWDIVAIRTADGRYLSAKENGEIRADAKNITESEMFELQDWGEGWKNLFSVKYRRYARLCEDGTIRLHNRKIYDWFTRETFNFKDCCGEMLIEEFLDHRRLSAENGNIMVRKAPAADDTLFTVELVSDGKKRAEDIARKSDLVIYCTGNHPVQTAKECYDRKTLALNVQPGMTQVLCAENKNTVLALISSYPYAIVQESMAAAAVLWSSHAGAELGNVIAAAVKGGISPSGRLPLTWYRSEYDLPDILDYDIETAGSTYMYFRGKPLYPFGYGLSYSTFGYGELRCEETENGVNAYIDITNTSHRDGTELVQIYFTVPGSQMKRADKKLCGFERIYVKAGETVTAKLFIPRYIFRIYDVRKKDMIVEDGEYIFMAGASSADIRSTAQLHINGSRLSERAGSFSAADADECENMKIYRSKRTGKDMLRPSHYTGTAVYRGIPHKNNITVWASSIIGTRKLIVTAGEEIREITVPPCDSYDDTKPFTAEFDDIREVKITISDGMCITMIETY